MKLWHQRHSEFQYIQMNIEIKSVFNSCFVVLKQERQELIVFHGNCTIFPSTMNI